MTKTRFSIITPSYNRACLLERLYLSLVNQSYSHLEWIVVDDGSTDNTREIISNIISKSPFIINYIYKENGGKHTALNAAFEAVNNDLILILDSDDMLAFNALEYIDTIWTELRVNPDIQGIISLCQDIDSNLIIGNQFPYDGFNSTITKNLFKYGIRGDKCDFIRASSIVSLRFPSFENEKFVPESIVTYEPDKLGYYYCVNKVLKLVEYQQGGMTKNFNRLTSKNPNGYFLRFKHLLQNCFIEQMSMLSKFKVFTLYFEFLMKSDFSFIAELNSLKIKKRYAILFIPTFLVALLIITKKILAYKIEKNRISY